MTRINSIPVAALFVMLGACSHSEYEVEPTIAAEIELKITGTSWQVESIDQEGVIDDSEVTLLFPEEGRVAGSAGCNRYFGSVTVDANSISFGNAGATMMACPEARMKQEQRFMDALNNISRGEIVDGDWLVLFDDTGAERIRAGKHTPAEEAVSTVAPQPLDKAAETGFSFDCGAAGSADVRFLGPETVELTFSGNTYVLPRERAASGAMYSVESVSFWNKGDEALIEIGAKRYSCKRK